ncbi:MAG TPA: ABC transporter ATP-binding protein [Acidimicrobiales bacterium]|jgi:oligopeptide/dipeptide ABC transporter ATP-binding protein|nr:ABC transporter ATP-binding protein [Acidimicrobiales bacterium]
MTAPGEPLLSVDDLHVRFRTDHGVVKAADGVSFAIWPDEVVGIVGESGSGKTVTALSVLRLLPATAEVTGAVTFGGRDLLTLPEADLRAVRGDRIALIFQDALAAMNPLHRVGRQVAEAIRVHHSETSRGDAARRAVELLGLVGIPTPEERARQFPQEFSGGMRQRAMIAMAMANDPDVLIADEPTTALDVTTQAQVLEVLKDVRRRTHSALVLITHDFGVVAGVADRVVVMYAGKVVESGTVEEVLLHPAHPYTKGLLASMPTLDREEERLARIPGQPPSLIDVPSGCAFHPRCPYAQLPDPCASALPELRPSPGAAADGHRSACHFSDRLVESG